MNFQHNSVISGENMSTPKEIEEMDPCEAQVIRIEEAIRKMNKAYWGNWQKVVKEVIEILEEAKR